MEKLNIAETLLLKMFQNQKDARPDYGVLEVSIRAQWIRSKQEPSELKAILESLVSKGFLYAKSGGYHITPEGFLYENPITISFDGYGNPYAVVDVSLADRVETSLQKADIPFSKRPAVYLGDRLVDYTFDFGSGADLARVRRALDEA